MAFKIGYTLSIHNLNNWPAPERRLCGIENRHKMYIINNKINSPLGDTLYKYLFVFWINPTTNYKPCSPFLNSLFKWSFYDNKKKYFQNWKLVGKWVKMWFNDFKGNYIAITVTKNVYCLMENQYVTVYLTMLNSPVLRCKLNTM